MFALRSGSWRSFKPDTTATKSRSLVEAPKPCPTQKKTSHVPQTKKCSYESFWPLLSRTICCSTLLFLLWFSQKWVQKTITRTFPLLALGLVVRSPTELWEKIVVFSNVALWPKPPASCDHHMQQRKKSHTEYNPDGYRTSNPIVVEMMI